MKKLWRKARINLLAFLGILTLTLLYKSMRWEYLKFAACDAKWPVDVPRMFVVWHGRQIMMPAMYSQFSKDREVRPICTIASMHSDGQIIARILRHFGFTTVAGSSSRGGVGATLGLLSRAKSGYDLAITPDGPRGPIYELKDGALDIASRLGAAIYPVAFSAEKYWQINSWDRMIIPKPFSRVVGIVGEPIYFSKEEMQKEDARDLVRRKLMKITEEADSHDYN